MHSHSLAILHLYWNMSRVKVYFVNTIQVCKSIKSIVMVTPHDILCKYMVMTTVKIQPNQRKKSVNVGLDLRTEDNF